MAGIVQFPWTRQPQGPIPTNRGNPLSQGLLYQATPNNLVANQGSLVGAVTTQPAVNGITYKSPGAGAYVSFPFPPSWAAASHAFTVSMIARFIGTPSLLNMWNLNHGTGANNQVAICYWDSVASARYMLMQTGAAAASAGNSTILASNPDVTLWHHWHMTWDGITARGKIYCDGIDLSANGAVGLTPIYNNKFDVATERRNEIEPQPH